MPPDSASLQLPPIVLQPEIGSSRAEIACRKVGAIILDFSRASDNIFETAADSEAHIRWLRVVKALEDVSRERCQTWIDLRAKWHLYKILCDLFPADSDQSRAFLNTIIEDLEIFFGSAPCAR